MILILQLVLPASVLIITHVRIYRKLVTSKFLIRRRSDHRIRTMSVQRQIAVSQIEHFSQNQIVKKPAQKTKRSHSMPPEGAKRRRLHRNCSRKLIARKNGESIYMFHFIVYLKVEMSIIKLLLKVFFLS